MILLTRRDFSIERTISTSRYRKTGAVVSFLGVVRGFSGKRKVAKLQFEADRGAAMKRLREIRLQAIRRFDLQDVVIIHRIGALNVSENIVLISVAASHRREAFAACSFLIEELKRSVPIWKKEYTVGGKERWVPGKTPGHRLRRTRDR